MGTRLRRFPRSCICESSSSITLHPRAFVSLDSYMFDIDVWCLGVSCRVKWWLRAPRPRCSIKSGGPWGSPEKSWNFKPAPMAPKVIKSVPKDENHKKWNLKSPAFDFCENVVFAILSFPKPCFKRPKIPDANSETDTKRGLETKPNKKKKRINKK